jgi:hypothetical protein
MPARSERARRRRSRAPSASAAGAPAVGGGAAAAGARTAGTAEAAGGCGLRSRESGAGRALLAETTRSGSRRAVDLGPMLLCIVGERRRETRAGFGRGEGRNDREGSIWFSWMIPPRRSSRPRG